MMMMKVGRKITKKNYTNYWLRYIKFNYIIYIGLVIIDEFHFYYIVHKDTQFFLWYLNR